MKPVVLVASGPSFTVAQATMIIEARAADRCRVLVVNDNWRRIPNADVLYACDGKWWDVYFAAVQASGFAGELWTQHKKAADKYELCFVVGENKEGLNKVPGKVNLAANGGYQAINLAYHFGAQRMVLVGYDMQPAPSKETHWFGRHPAGLSNSHPYSLWQQHFPKLAQDLAALGIEVVNCSTHTALTCFKLGDLNGIIGQGDAGTGGQPAPASGDTAIATGY